MPSMNMSLAMNASEGKRAKMCIDLGASQIKLIYQLEDQSRPRVLTLLPNVIQINADQVKVYSNGLEVSEDIGWVKTTAKAETVIAVDRLAEKTFYCADYEQLKINTGDWRIMAAIGKVLSIEKVKIPENGQDLDLTILLPFGEFKKDDVQLFKTNLTKRLKSFYYRGKRLKINLKSLKSYPEGIGSLIGEGRETNERSVVVMLGHRNSSYLFFEKKKFVQGKSIQLGFHTLVEDFCQRTSGQEENNLLILTLWQSRLNLDSLKRVTKTRREQLSEQELEKLKTSAKTSQADLWIKIKQWLLKELDHIDFDKMRWAGGTSEFLKPLIEQDQVFGSLPLSFVGTKNVEIINQKIDFKHIRKQEIEDLSLRIVDCYGVFSNG